MGRNPGRLAASAFLVVFGIALLGDGFDMHMLARDRVVKHAPVEVKRDANSTAIHPREAQTMSSNWAGYVLPNFETGQKYTSASATWTVPAVTFDFEDQALGVTAEFSSAWVGIGGYCKNAPCNRADRKLIQIGTEHDAFDDGSTQYYAWYEMLPKFPVIITAIAINPGDVITASLSCSGKCANKQSWTLQMTDETTGAIWSKQVNYHASKLSANWIIEAPTGIEFKGQRVGVLPLADYSTITFSGALANDAAADLSSGDSLEMIDDSNDGRRYNSPWGQTSSVSSAAGDQFDGCWGSQGVLPPCS